MPCAARSRSRRGGRGTRRASHGAPSIGISRESATVPKRGAREWRAWARAPARRKRLPCEGGFGQSWGQAGVGPGVRRPLCRGATARSKQAIAATSIELRFQPQIEPATGRIAGVEALARWSGAQSPEELFARAEAAGLAERLSRADPAQGAAHRRRLGRPACRRCSLSINLLPRDLDRPGYEQWLLAEIAEAGLEPEQVTAEIVESSLVADSLEVAGRLARLRAAGRPHRDRRFRHRLFEPRLSHLASARRDQDRPRPDRRHRRRQPRPDRRQGDDPPGPRARPQGHRRRRREPAQLRLLDEWGCDLYQGFLGAGAARRGRAGALRRRALSATRA